ncbi:putative ATP-dependent helicase domain protein [Mycobacterium xenopi 3993]|nr:putative ATP-dependent helicase domain protein [Mycobacterium xenopi 3993]
MAVEDIGRLRDSVGVAVPVGVPDSFTDAVADPLGELLGRYARTHTPFTTAEAAARFGLGLRVTADVLGRLAADGRLVRGDFVADLGASSGATPRCCGFCGAGRWRRCGPGRTGQHRRVCAVPAGLAAGGQRNQFRCRRAAGRHRSARRRADARFGNRAAGAGAAGA